MKRILFDPLPAEGGTPTAPPAPVAPGQPAQPPAGMVTADPAAARAVLNGKTEHELELERQLAERDGRIRNLETTVSERERDLQILRTPPTPPTPAKRNRPVPTVIGSSDEEGEE